MCLRGNTASHDIIMFLCKVPVRQWNIIQWDAVSLDSLNSDSFLACSLSRSNTLCPQFEHNWIDWLLYNIHSEQLKEVLIETQRERERYRQRDLRSPVQRKKMRWEHAENDLFYLNVPCWKTALLVASIYCVLNSSQKYEVYSICADITTLTSKMTLVSQRCQFNQISFISSPLRHYSNYSVI